MERNLGVGRKDENSHAVLLGDFGEVNIANHIGTARLYFVMDGSDLDAEIRKKQAISMCRNFSEYRLLHSPIAQPCSTRWNSVKMQKSLGVQLLKTAQYRLEARL